MKKVLIALAALVALVPFLAAVAGMGMFLLGGDEWPPASGETAEPTDQIPIEMWGLYNNAASRFAVPASLVAAVGKVECDHG
ncbi:MAG: hypothetical protein ACRD0S_03990, partial [Acidimicrobiales bacterium]